MIGRKECAFRKECDLKCKCLDCNYYEPLEKEEFSFTLDNTEYRQYYRAWLEYIEDWG